jgi:hypothetical protein
MAENFALAVLLPPPPIQEAGPDTRLSDAPLTDAFFRPQPFLLRRCPSLRSQEQCSRQRQAVARTRRPPLMGLCNRWLISAVAFLEVSFAGRFGCLVDPQMRFSGER